MLKKPKKKAVKTKKTSKDQQKTKKTKKTAVSWLQKGKEARRVYESERTKTELRRKASGQGLRFWLLPKESARITFLDGDLNDDGMIDCPMFFEHRVKVAGRWDNFVCTQQIEPCPICEQGDEATYVGVMTVIDHRKIRSTANPKKVYKDQAKLLIVKPTSYAILHQAAKKRKGLVGWRAEVSRTGEQKPRIGDVWDFEKKLGPKALSKYADEDGELPVANYEEAIRFLTADELRQLGFGKGGGELGSDDDADFDDDDLDEELE